MRTVFGILFGVIAAMLIVEAVDRAGLSLYPLLVPLETADPDTLASVIIDMPLPAKILIVMGWLLSAFGGAWLTLRICDRRWTGWFVVVVVMGIGILNVTTLPHPLWMKVCAVAMPILGGVLAIRAHRKPYPGEALLG